MASPLSLPGAPQTAQHPSPGPGGGYTPNARGTLPYKESGLSSFVGAISGFMNQMIAGKKAEREEALQRVEQNMKLLSMGIPVDKKQIAKDLQTGGIKLDMNGPDPALQKKYEQEQSQRQQMEQAPGMLGPAMQGANATMPPSPPPSMPPPQQGFGQKVMQNLGLASQPAPAEGAPIYGALGNIQKMGQMSQQSEMEQMKYKQLTTGILKQAVEGQPEALQLANHLGLVPKMSSEENMEIWMKLAGASREQVGQAMINIAIAPHTQAMATRQLALHRASMEERKQYLDQLHQYREAFPNAPIEIITQLLEGTNSGNSKMRDDAASVLGQNFSAKQIEQMNKDREAGFKVTELKQSAEKLGIDLANVQVANGRLREEQMWHTYQKAKDLDDAATKALDHMVKTLSSKEFKSLSEDTRKTLTDGMLREVNKTTKGGNFTMEDVSHWYLWPAYLMGRDKYQLKFQSGQVSPSVGAAVGGPKPASSTSTPPGQNIAPTAQPGENKPYIFNPQFLGLPGFGGK